MITEIGLGIRKLRNLFNRSYLAVRLFRLSKSEGTATAPGLVLIQIDGFSFKQYQRGLREGNLPFLRSLLSKQKYRDYVHYSGMPSNTPAVQGELFYGTKGCVPAFNFVDRLSGEAFMMLDPTCAHEIETRISQDAEALLKGGSSYFNIFTGSAAESHYCVAGGGWGRLFQIFNPFTWLLVLIFHLNIFLRTVFLILLEVVIGIYDFVRGAIGGNKIVPEFKFILSRALVCVLFRELVVMGVKIDIARGLPIIHLNLVGYDEQSHRRGPSSKFAHWSLRGIDDAIRRVWKEARLAERRDYDIWIYSDHGQEDSILYSAENGRSIEEAVASIFEELASSKIIKSKIHFPHANRVEHAGSKVIAVGMGPLVHIYPSPELSPEEKERVISELLVTAKVPVVLIPKEAGQVEARTLKEKFILPGNANEIFGADHPFLREVTCDLVSLCHHPSAGKIIISGECQGRKPMSFASENGCHAGYGPEETRGFALLSPDAPLSIQGRAYLRPLDIREAALRYLGRTSGLASELPPPSGITTLRVMTYNVHGCVGLDGKTSPDRIARVIARQGADVVALQEIDVRRNRSGKIDQAECIACKLGMVFHFQSSLSLEDGKFGNAILSRYPLKIIRIGALPRLSAHRFFEPRGALWVEIDVSGVKINLITSHLSLWPAERLLQTEALLGSDWTGSVVCQGPVILCGDFNANPRSRVCQRIGGKLRDAQLIVESHKPKSTWLSSHPISRIDHFFVSQDIEVMNITVPATELDRIASDHLPLIVDMKVGSCIDSEKERSGFLNKPNPASSNSESRASCEFQAYSDLLKGF
ncbi:MAG: endonuclease/exonuclease/phosphatase family protein [Candidatus Omnitrophica bacterium]|nr:endonuclease/exonuclease/phosphatase family protein [Candidatus Omnitrophota bacterium]